MKTRQTGFTLIELIFTIVVAAVLLGIGAPSFREFLQNSRMASAANDLIADVALTRSEAIKRHISTGICSSPDPFDADPECVDPDDDDVFTGWIVWIDDPDPLVDAGTDADGLRNNSEEVLRRYEIPESIDAIVAGTRLSVNPAGFVRPGVADTLTQMVMCDERGTAITAGGVSAARGIRVTQTGRALITRDKADIESSLGGCP